MNCIYDRALIVYELPDGTPLQRKLQPVSRHLYAETEVYHSRYWESVQAGDSIDLMVCVADGRRISAHMYCVPEDGHVYRIAQVQHGKDDSGLDMTTLSLHRAEGSYDVAGA